MIRTFAILCITVFGAALAHAEEPTDEQCFFGDWPVACEDEAIEPKEPKLFEFGEDEEKEATPEPVADVPLTCATYFAGSQTDRMVALHQWFTTQIGALPGVTPEVMECVTDPARLMALDMQQDSLCKATAQDGVTKEDYFGWVINSSAKQYLAPCGIRSQ